MRRTLFIILSVVAVVLIIGFTLAQLAGPRIGNTFNAISHSLPGSDFGYGGGEPDGRALKESAPGQAPVPALQPSSASDVYNAAQPASERLVIKTATLTVVVKDLKAHMADINSLTGEFKGYVVSSNFYEDTSTGRTFPRATISIRVPAEKLEEALARIKKDVVEVPLENVTGQDVTQTYMDLQAQLRAKEAAEKKLLEIMDQATRAQDVLATYLEVQNIQTQIEQLKSQIQYYDEAVAMSLITVDLIAEESTQPIQVGPWTPTGAAKEAIQNLIIFFQDFVEFLIYFVLNTIPKLILIAIPLWLIYLAGRALYRRFRKAKPAPEEIKG